MNVSAAFPLENAGWPAMLVNPDGVILRTNASGMEVFGSAAYEGKNLKGFWADESPFTPQFLSSAVNQQRKLRLKGGGAASFLVTLLPLVNADLKNYLVQFFAFDAGATSDKVSAKLEPSPAVVIDAGVAQKQKLDCAMQLARSVALDFNNALTSILGHTSLLLGRAETDHPWRNSLVEIEKSAERAAEISNDLANFSRQEGIPGRKAGNLNDLLRQAVDVFRTQENRHIEFNLELERSLFTAKFDEAKLQQAFSKILENAVQAISKSGSIVARSRNCELESGLNEKTLRLASGTYICIEVADTGCGIAEDQLPRVFEPFFTSKEKPHRGLGLTWVYGIVTNHGGGVCVSSKAGEGTVVQVYLPATKRIVRESSQNPNELWGVEAVLIVDDEELLLNMSQMVLSSFGYRALTASSGQKALRILSNEVIDLVIVDLVMPNMSGRELIDRIRMVSPGVKIICSSGYLRPQNEAEEFYLQKPFTAQSLLRKVREVLSMEHSA